MNLFHFIKKKYIAAVLILCCTMPVMAQTAATSPAPTVTSGSNQLAILLVVMSAVLAFVIWGLGQVLVVLSRQLMEKNKNAGKVLSAVALIVLLLAAQTAPAQTTAAAADAAKVLPNYGGLSSSSFNMFLIVIIAEVTAIIFLLIAIRRIYSELMPSKAAVEGQQSALRQWWTRMDARLFTKAVPLAKEADVMLDHDYDGIKELDNALPPWWKYGFYITIAVGFVYLLNFHVLGNGKNPTQEYAAEMNQARIEKELFEANNKDKIDENNVPMADETGLAKAKDIFNTKCWSCHGKLGEGGAGPNLTDDYWIHKGSLNDIYRSVKVGYPDKGMQSWANDYTPKEMSFLASYIKTMRGTNPPGAKAAQGDLYTEEVAAPAPADSAKAAAPVKAADKTAVAEKKDSVAAGNKK
jgi:cytochrome c oxidase cbb3-type subunit III